MNEATAVANRILQGEGFVIVAWLLGEPIPRVGEVLDFEVATLSEDLPGPFVVKGTATVDEFEKQNQKYGLVNCRDASWQYLKVAAE